MAESVLFKNRRSGESLTTDITLMRLDAFWSSPKGIQLVVGLWMINSPVFVELIVRDEPNFCVCAGQLWTEKWSSVPFYMVIPRSSVDKPFMKIVTSQHGAFEMLAPVSVDEIIVLGYHIGLGQFFN